MRNNYAYVEFVMASRLDAT